MPNKPFSHPLFMVGAMAIALGMTDEFEAILQGKCSHCKDTKEISIGGGDIAICPFCKD